MKFKKTSKTYSLILEIHAIVRETLFELGKVDGLAAIIIHDAKQATKPKNARGASSHALISQLFNRIL